MSAKKTFTAILTVFLSMLACQSAFPPTATPEPPNDVYLGLRQLWFTSGPEQAGITAVPESKTPYVIVMDVSLKNGTATITSSIAGDGSMYTSNGGGLLGCYFHEESKKACRHFVEIAAGFVEKMHIVTEFPLPAANHVIFYAITSDGVYSSGEINTDLLAAGDHELSPLFIAANEVITELRQTTGE